MKKIIGYILVAIPVLNLIGKMGAAAGNRDVSISPAALIILVMMFIGGIILITGSTNDKDEPPSKDLAKKDD